MVGRERCQLVRATLHTASMGGSQTQILQRTFFPAYGKRLHATMPLHRDIAPSLPTWFLVHRQADEPVTVFDVQMVSHAQPSTAVTSWSRQIDATSLEGGSFPRYSR